MDLFELFHQEYLFSVSSLTYSKGDLYRVLKYSQLSLMAAFLEMLVSWPGGKFCFMAAHFSHSLTTIVNRQVAAGDSSSMDFSFFCTTSGLLQVGLRELCSKLSSLFYFKFLQKSY